MATYEIERKFLINKLPFSLTPYPFHTIEQGYLCTNPVVRIRKEDDQYYLTYKGNGLLKREEYNLDLTEDAYFHLKEKIDGILITKKRYLIPIENTKYTVELDIFEGDYTSLILAEVEFPSEKEANEFAPLSWFGEDVTSDTMYHNSTMSLRKNS